MGGAADRAASVAFALGCSLEEAQFAATFERVGPRAHGELAVDRPNVAMDRVVRHIQFTTDISLRQIAAQELEHPELPRCQLAILG